MEKRLSKDKLLLETQAPSQGAPPACAAVRTPRTDTRCRAGLGQSLVLGRQLVTHYLSKLETYILFDKRMLQLGM